MNGDQSASKSVSLLSSEDKADGFSITFDNYGGVTLLRWGRQIAWFSAAVCGEVLQALVEVVKAVERNERRHSTANK